MGPRDNVFPGPAVALDGSVCNIQNPLSAPGLFNRYCVKICISIESRPNLVKNL